MTGELGIMWRRFVWFVEDALLLLGRVPLFVLLAYCELHEAIARAVDPERPPLDY
jgi:hypothetical protein